MAPSESGLQRRRANGNVGRQRGRGRGRVVECDAVDPSRARGLLWSWLQRTHKAQRPAEHVSLEHNRSKKGHSCTAWVWIDDDWTHFAADGWFPSRAEAIAGAYASSVAGLGVPVPKDCILTDEAKAKQRKREQAEEQRTKAIASAVAEIEVEILKALFPDSSSDFRTPREREEEEIPEPLQGRLLLPPPVEARPNEERGNKAMQQLKLLVKRESKLLEGPSMHEVSRSVPGGSVHVCACSMLFDSTVAVVGTAWAAKRATARAAAASAAFSRVDTAAALPSREEAKEHAPAVMELRRLQQLQPFKLWVLEGAQPNDLPRWYCALWGQLPFQGGLRDYWGEGANEERVAAVAEACGGAAAQLTRLLGSSDCVQWLQAMARVTMEVEEFPPNASKALLDAEKDDDSVAEKLKGWLDARTLWRDVDPPDLSGGPAVTSVQVYEPQPEDGPLETARRARGVPLLPVLELRTSLCEVLCDNACVVVSGGTGSGKSTQIPQYILDDFQPSAGKGTDMQNAGNGHRAWTEPPRVIVTEPRRIAAVSLAERVAWERGEALGRSVGYSVKADSKAPRCRTGTVEYCTVGILLRRLQEDPSLRHVSHVIVDEVHERDLMTDFLLILLKELLCVRSDFRVLLMSATLDVRTFSNYLWNCPCLEIPTGPRYEVQDFYLEDPAFESLGRNLPAQLLSREEDARRVAEDAREGEEENEADDSRSAGVWWGSAENDEMYIELMSLLIMRLANGPALLDDQDRPGSVLCFLPGWAEIKNCMDRLQDLDRHAQLLWVLPLHSTLPKEEQQLIFKHPPQGKTKVILGTNIAESSVTIDDVLVVIDSGLAREVSYDPVRRLSTLETVWVSQSSAIQRMGRAGRVRKGQCFRLYSRAQLDLAPWRTTPEMQRCDLTSTCLQALALWREARDFLGRAPDAPTRAAVEVALEELLQLGAICPSADSRGVGSSGMRERMMPLGEALSRMTVSPKLGRMLIMGTIFGEADAACLLAAVIAAQRRVFACPPGKKKESLACVRGFSPSSDIMAAYTACRHYEGWERARGEQYADRWAGDLFLVAKRVRQLLSARDQHREELQRAGLLSKVSWKDSEWSNAQWAADGGWDDGGWGQGGWGEAGWKATEALIPEVPVDKADKESERFQLVKAFLVLAYPQSLALRRRVGFAKHNTPSGLEAIIAPQSVNAPSKAKCSARSDEKQPTWWSYGQMQISNGQGFLRATTLVDPYHVALFGGLRTVEDAGALREIDGWIELRGSRSTLRSVARLRAAMTRCVHLRTLDPHVPLPEGYNVILQQVSTLLQTAVARQAYVEACLPESQSYFVEAPPSSSWNQRDEWQGRRRR